MIFLKGLYKTYINSKNSKYSALHNINLTIKDGEFLGIVGKSGSGKTTLLNILACLDNFDNGEMTLDGQNVAKLNDTQLSKLRNKTIGIVMQNFDLIEDRTVFDNVMLPLLFGHVKKGEKQVIRALSLIGIEDLRNKRVMELSGGQKQRVAIARAIVNNPKYLFADEPTGALDSVTCVDIMNVFRSLNQNGVTVCVVTHDNDVVKYCSEVINISDGSIV